MIWCQRDFIAHLKTVLPYVFVIHRVIDSQHLVAKEISERLNTPLDTVIKAVKLSRLVLSMVVYSRQNEDFVTRMKKILNDFFSTLQFGGYLKRCKLLILLTL